MVAVVVVLGMAGGVRGAQAQADPVAVDVKEAQRHYQAANYALAIALLERVVDDHRHHSSAATAAELLLDALNRKRMYARMATRVAGLLADKRFLSTHPRMEHLLRRLQQALGQRRAEQLAKRREFDTCGRTYVDTYNQHPRGALADQLLYNAAICFGHGKSIGAAIKVLRPLVTRFPKSKLARRGLLMLARLWQRVAYYDRALQRYKEYARRYGAAKDARDAFVNALRLQYALGPDSETIKLAEGYLRRFRRGSTAETARVLSLLAELYERAKRPAKQVNALTRLGSVAMTARLPGMRSAAFTRLAEIYWAQACTRAADSSACTKLRWRRPTVSARSTTRARCGGRVIVLTYQTNRAKARRAHALFKRVASVQRTAGSGVHRGRAAMLAAYYAGQPLARAFLLNQSAASLAALSKYLAPLTVPRALLQLGDANALMYCNHRAAGDQARRARAVSAYTACIREANSSLRGQRFAGLCRDRLRRLGAHGYPDVDERYGRNIGFSHLRSLEQPALRRR